MARRVGGHIRQHDRGAAAHQCCQLRRHAVIHEVAHEDRGTRNRIHWQQVDADHPGGPALHRHLRPAAGRSAEVYDPGTLCNQVEAVIQLHKLEGCA